MSTAINSQKDIKALAPSRENTISAVLNGVGNAAMVAGAAVWAMGEKTRKENHRLVLAGTAVSVFLGALWGLREAKQVSLYRGALLEEIQQLRQEVDGLKAENLDWKQRMTAQKAHAAKAEPQI